MNIIINVNFCTILHGVMNKAHKFSNETCAFSAYAGTCEGLYEQCCTSVIASNAYWMLHSRPMT
jgi:hypothetical protein